MSEQTKEKLIPEIELRYAVHMLVIFVFAIGIAWFSNEIILENAWNGKYFIFTGLLCGVIALCSFLERKKLYEKVRTLGILIACFVVSGLLLLLSDYYINLPVWVIGGIVAAALVNRNIGMLYLYYFVFHAIYLQGSWLNGLVFHFAVASLIAFFIPKMKNFLSMLYMMAFAACIIVTGSIIHNQMAIDGNMLLDTFYILCTYLVCILITMLLVKWNTDRSTEGEDSYVSDNYEYLELLAEHTARKDAEALAAATDEAAVTAETVHEEAEAEETAEVEAEEPVAEETVEVEAEEPVPEEIVEEVEAEEPVPEVAVEEVEAEEPVPEETVEEVEAEETVPEETVEEVEAEEPVTEAAGEEAEAEETETTAEESVTEETIEETEAELVVEEPVEEVKEEVPIDYTPYCDEKSELLQELRAKDKASYARAVLVGKLASTTAESMGLDKDLTKAAGLYKFIGKIRENNDEYTATEIAKEHNFPEPLIYLLDQLNHNIVEQKEAAVILITYGVISNYSIIRGAKKDVPVEKIVDTVVTKKIFQGEFNESGLNVQECFMLREKLITLLNAQDKKHVAK